MIGDKGRFCGIPVRKKLQVALHIIPKKGERKKERNHGYTLNRGRFDSILMRKKPQNTLLGDWVEEASLKSL